MYLLDFFSKKQSSQDNKVTQLLESLRQAERDYNVALSCFEEVTETEKVDETIFLMQAAKIKYSYYLKKLRCYTLENKQSM